MSVGQSSPDMPQPAQPAEQDPKHVNMKVTPGGGLLAATGSEMTDLHMYHRDNRSKKEPTEEELAEKAYKEEETNKYADGVSRIEGYMLATEMTPQEVQAFLAAPGRDIHLPMQDGETAEAYLKRAAPQLFLSARNELFGRSTVLAQGGDVTPEALARVQLFGRERMLPFLEVFNKGRLRKQIGATREQITKWEEHMEDTRTAVKNAEVTLAWRVNHGRGVRGANPGLGRGELYVDPRVLPSLMREGAQGLENLLNETGGGELVNPLQSVFERFIRPEKGRQTATAEGVSAEDTAGKTIIEQARARLAEMTNGFQGRAGEIIDVVTHFIPPEALPLITKGDTLLSTKVEQLADLASQSPEKIFQAREALLDLRAFSEAVFKTTNGRVDIMRGLNNHLRAATRKLTNNRMGMTVDDILAHTQYAAEDYMVTNPTAGLTKLFSDLRRQRIAMGGDTPVQRRIRKAAWAAGARMRPDIMAVIDKIHGQDEPVVVQEEPLEESEETVQEESVKPWQIFKKVSRWNAERGARSAEKKRHNAAVRAANSFGFDAMPQPTKGAGYRAEEVQRERGYQEMSDEQLWDVINQNAERQAAEARARENEYAQTDAAQSAADMKARQARELQERAEVEAQRQRALEQIRVERHNMLVAAARSGRLDQERMNAIDQRESALLMQHGPDSARNKAELARIGAAQDELTAATTYDVPQPTPPTEQTPVETPVPS